MISKETKEGPKESEEEIPPHWARDQTAGSQIETEAKKQETRVRLHRSHRLGSPGVMAKGTSLFWIGGNHGMVRIHMAQLANSIIVYDKRASGLFTFFLRCCSYLPV